MSALPQKTYSPEEYLALERRSERKHEYFRGEIFLMSGASRPHNMLVANLIASIHSGLAGKPCVVFPSDLRVKCPSGLYTYPDAIIVCGEERLEDHVKDTLLNPTVLFEVLSPSTEGYDRGTKADHYRGIASLQEYVLISQDRFQVEHYLRTEDHRWILTTHHGPEETVKLQTGPVEISLRSLYANVGLAESDSSLRTPYEEN